MTTEALKSATITSLDATPPVRKSVGAGGAGDLEVISEVATATTGKTAGSTYQLVRLPSNCYLKHLFVWIDGSVTTFDGDVTLYYSTAAFDGTQVALSGTAVASHIFITAKDWHTAAAPLDLMAKSNGGNLAASARMQPLWQAAGLSSDPGGFFDVTLVSTSTTSGAPIVSCEAQYVFGS